jgi:hypothetical protein
MHCAGIASRHNALVIKRQVMVPAMHRQPTITHRHHSIRRKVNRTQTVQYRRDDGAMRTKRRAKHGLTSHGNSL